MIQKAINLFDSLKHYDKEHGEWIANNIGDIMTYACNIKVGEEVDLIQHMRDTYGEEKIHAIIKLFPYISGPYSPLTMTFEDKNGNIVNVINYVKDKNDGKCISNSGEELSADNVFIVFRRNSESAILQEVENNLEKLKSNKY